MDCELFWKNPNSIRNIRHALKASHDQFLHYLPADQSELAEQRKALQDSDTSLPATNDWEIEHQDKIAPKKAPAIQSKKSFTTRKMFHVNLSQGHQISAGS